MVVIEAKCQGVIVVDKAKSKIPKKLEQRLRQTSPRKEDISDRLVNAEKNRAAFYASVSNKATQQISRLADTQKKVMESLETAKVQNRARHEKAAHLRKANLMAIAGKAVLESQKIEEAHKRSGANIPSPEKIAAKLDNAAKNRRAFYENVSQKASKQILRQDDVHKKVSQSVETARVNYETRMSKAVDSREACLQAKTEKAVNESMKVKEALLRASADKAVAARKFAEKTHASATVINVNIQRKSQKIPKNLEERLMNTTL